LAKWSLDINECRPTTLQHVPDHFAKTAGLGEVVTPNPNRARRNISDNSPSLFPKIGTRASDLRPPNSAEAFNGAGCNGEYVRPRATRRGIGKRDRSRRVKKIETWPFSRLRLARFVANAP